MQDITTTNGYRPAKGLLRLTWPQIETIDAKISSLCAFTEESSGEAELVIKIKKGKVRFVEMRLSEELSPARTAT
jgi:hypothetical protein